MTTEIVPVVEVSLAAGEGVYFEHHVLLWKEERVPLEVLPLQGMFKRLLAGMPLVITTATVPNRAWPSTSGAWKRRTLASAPEPRRSSGVGNCRQSPTFTTTWSTNSLTEGRTEMYSFWTTSTRELTEMPRQVSVTSASLWTRVR